MSLLLLFAGSQGIDLNDGELREYEEAIKRRYKETQEEKRGREKPKEPQKKKRPKKELRPTQDLSGEIKETTKLLSFYDSIFWDLVKELETLEELRQSLALSDYQTRLAEAEARRELVLFRKFQYERQIEEEEIITLLALM